LDELSRRVSDLEREETAAALRGDLLAGRLTLEEFSERIGIAYGARVGAELMRVRKDLPALAPSRRRPIRLSVALFGHLVRRGRLRLKRRTLALGAFADIDLDLREAQIDSPRVTVHLFVLAGNLDLYIPEGIDIEVGGTILFGRRRDWGRDAARAGAPTLRVRVHGFVGTVDIWRVPSDVRGTYRDVIAQIEERQRELPT
jgi:hypothetical protein